MSKQVAKKQSTEVAPTFDMSEFETDMNPKDIIIPRIKVMQGLSPEVMEGQAKFGDFLDTRSNEVIGDIDNPIEFIPLTHYSVWHIFEGNELTSIEPVTRANANLPWKEGNIRRSYARNIYCLIPGQPVPYIIGFKGTSSRAGQEVISQMDFINKAVKLPPFGKVMQLAGKKEKNDQGTFVVLKTKQLRNATNEELNEAYKWYKTIKSGETKTREDDVIKDDVPF